MRLRIMNKLLKSIRIFIKFTVLAAISMFTICLLFALFYYCDNRLFLWQARWLWPQRPFVAEEFQKGTPAERATMVVDIIKSKRFLGQPMDFVTRQLGPETGDYYYNDGHQTYKLTDRDRKNTNWILTVLSDNSRNAEKVFIRKSCCSISKKMLYAGVTFLMSVSHFSVKIEGL